MFRVGYSPDEAAYNAALQRRMNILEFIDTYHGGGCAIRHIPLLQQLLYFQIEIFFLHPQYIDHLADISKQLRVI